MSWLERLYQTYECNCNRPVESGPALTPPFHTAQNAHLSIQIKGDGVFAGARLLTDKATREKIIPCTEESSARTSGICAHPLFDSLQYLAGDLTDYINCPRNQDSFVAYIAQLSEWCASPQADPLVCKVFNYLKQATLTKDLLEAGILQADSNGKVIASKEDVPSEMETPPLLSLVTGDISKAFAVFEYLDAALPNPNLCENPAVRQSWIDYSIEQSTKTGRQGFCQILGKETGLATLHPKRIRNAGDGAKLISGNDKTNFTYRGRFEDPLDAAAVSIEVSQKAHAALRWLLAKQGTHDADQYIVAWAVSPQPETPRPVCDSAEFLDELLDFSDTTEIDTTDVGTAENMAKALNAKLAGYRKQIAPERLSIMMVDSATPGTMAVRYYRELSGSEFLDNLEYWHTRCAWQQNFGKEKHFYGAPAPRDIARAAYGNLDLSDRRMSMTVARLLPCITERRPFPADLLRSVIRRTGNPLAQEVWEFNKNLGIACALYRFNHQERNYQMALEKDCASRDYLYGRLLATADYLESSALQLTDENRSTNAMRLMQRFSERPYSSWLTLDKALQSYRERLQSKNPKKLVFLERLLGEIHVLFNHAEFCSDKPLSGEYLLGYYCQKAEFFAPKNEKTESAEAVAEA